MLNSMMPISPSNMSLKNVYLWCLTCLNALHTEMFVVVENIVVDSLYFSRRGDELYE